jgi:hypothetical protein
MALAFDRLLNLVYFWATEDAEEADRDRFDVRLNKPDERARRRGAAALDQGPWSPEAERAALGGLVASLTGRAGA